MMKAEQSHQRQESATFQSFLRAQQEAEELRFKALHEQNQENNKMFLQLIGNVMHAMSSQTSYPPPSNWMSLQPQTAYSMPLLPTQHAMPQQSMAHLPTQSAMLSPPFLRMPQFMPTPPAIPTPSAMPTTATRSPPSVSTLLPTSTPSVNRELEWQQPIPLTITVEEENDGPSISFS